MRRWIVIGGIGLLCLVTIGSQGEHSAPVAAPDHASEAGYAYPPDVEASFRRNFANSPGMGDCALKATEQRYSYDDFVSISHAYGGTGTLPPSLQAIVLTCAQSLQ